jgi:hypothetical protein
MRAIRQVLCPVLLAGFLPWAMTAKAAQITLVVTQVAETDGSLSYKVNARPTSSSPQASLIAPDGTTAISLDPILESGLSYAQLASRFFGQWTIQDNAPSTNTFHFTFAELPQLPIPTMVSPVEGAALGTSIHAEWTFPDGQDLSFPTMSAGSLDPISFSFDVTGGANQGTTLVDLNGLPSATGHCARRRWLFDPGFREPDHADPNHTVSTLRSWCL